MGNAFMQIKPLLLDFLFRAQCFWFLQRNCEKPWTLLKCLQVEVPVGVGYREAALLPPCEDMTVQEAGGGGACWQ